MRLVDTLGRDKKRDGKHTHTQTDRQTLHTRTHIQTYNVHSKCTLDSGEKNESCFAMRLTSVFGQLMFEPVTTGSVETL